MPSCILVLRKTYRVSSQSRFILYGFGRTKDLQQSMHMLVAVRHLPRSGWSVGRAGLGEKRPTLSKGRIQSFNAVGVGLFSHWLVSLGILTVMGVIRRIRRGNGINKEAEQ